ncbi:hypothetical protein V0288_12185 [Pannus brasiliensis CCIBt3594]|uniref:Uncharacterized protein n=1 Tax=Pannus brasiliensis CCIBt3594 TaxID=1427578 RepID=A0AAW9QU93_9CHRO
MKHSNLTRSLALLLAGTTTFFAFGEIFPPKLKPASARSIEREEVNIPSIESGGARLPDWERITFRLIPAVEKAGSLDLSSLARELGYDPSRSWDAGDRITSILMLGDLAEATDLPSRSLQSILDRVGLSPGSLSLADFGAIDKQTLKTLVKAIPDLADLSLGDVAPFYDLVEKELGGAIADALSGELLGDLVTDDLLGDLSLDSLNLAGYALDSIPGLLDAPLSEFARWGETLIGEIPGLADLPFADFFIDLGTPGVFALVDVVFGSKEARRTNTVTGSDVVGFAYPCNGNDCAHIELTGPDWLGATLIRGKQWISGNSQRVAGGSGCLAGEEPTGRHPFGRGFKVVLTDTDEAEGIARFGIYFRFSIFCGTSPYIIGPFPWIPLHEKDFIFLGIP